MCKHAVTLMKVKPLVPVRLRPIRQMWEQSCPTGTTIPTWCYSEYKYFHKTKEEALCPQRHLWVFQLPFLILLKILLTLTVTEICNKINWGLQWIQAFIQGSLKHFEEKIVVGYHLSAQYGHIVQCSPAGWMESVRLQNSIPAM